MLRKTIFWIHLFAGCTAGLIVLVMSVTGVLLTYERQIIEWADRGRRSQPPSANASRLQPEDLLRRIQDVEGTLPASLTLTAERDGPAQLPLGRRGNVYVDAYSGRVLGPGDPAPRNFFRTVTNWHRWLAMEGAGRATGRAITGACNLAFLFLVLSGIYLWMPRRWSRSSVRAVLLFRSGVSGKARDFNWHNVIGFWAAIPLVLIVASGAVISYPWASDLVYHASGVKPPPRKSAPTAPRPVEAQQQSALDLTGLNLAWSRASATIPGWRTATLRVPTRAN